MVVAAFSFAFLPYGMHLVADHLGPYLAKRGGADYGYDTHEYGFTNWPFRWPELLYGRVKTRLNSYSKKEK